MKTLIAYFSLMVIAAATVIPAESSVINPRETPIVKVVKENAEAVVNISTERIILLRENPAWGSYGNELDYFFGEFFGLQRRSRMRKMKLNSVGSGVVINKEGLIVTNAHVIHRASNIFVVFNDGNSIPGKVVYEDPQNDLAIVKVKPEQPLKVAKLGSAADVMIGETAVAIGNPLGLENSVSAGIISGKKRDIHSSRGEIVLEGLIQTDAPINPGNSGGALLNLDGELIGINVAVVQNSQSIGFAIPIDKVKAAVQSHANNEKFRIKRRTKVAFPPQGTATPQPIPQQDDWDPFAQLERMKEEMDMLFEGMFNAPSGQGNMGMFNTDIFYSPDINIDEQDDRYVIKLDVSGLNQDKLEIDIKNYSITISGESSSQTEESGPDRNFRSQSFSSFMKTIPLPQDADPDKIKSDVADNVLTITLPKKK